MSGLKQRWTADGGYRQFLIIAVPLILSTGAWSVQQFVDRMFLSWYSPEAIAAAVPASMLNFSITSLFIGTAGYVSTFVAQYFGAARYHRIGPALWQGLYVSLIGGLLLLAFIPLAPSMFSLVGHNLTIRELEVQYFQVLCLGSFPAIGASALSGFFAGRGRPWPIMWINLLVTVVNILLDYAMIFGHWGSPEMGIVGAGVATVVAQLCGTICFLLLISTPSANQMFHTLKGWKPESELFIRLIRFGLPSGIQFFLDMSTFSLFILLVGRLGTPSLAATNIAFNINMIAFLPMLGSGMAISVLVGQHLGRNRPDLAQKSTYSGFHMTFFYTGVVALAYLLLPDLFIAPFAAKADPASFAEIYGLTLTLLRFVALYCLFDTMSIVFASAVRGAGDTRFVMFMMGGVSIFLLVIPTYIAVVVAGMGLIACWIIVSLYIAALGVAFFSRFLSGKWKDMRVIEGTDISGPLDSANSTV